MGNTFTIGKKFIHPVAESYFLKVSAAGGNVVDKDIVNTFVWELSRIIDPQFWVCWPLRSSQNIGTGTTAFSLGGLGNYPGTLVNGPVWSESGLIQNATQQRIATQFNLSLTMSFFGVVNRASADTWIYLGQRINTSSNNPINLALHQPTSQARFVYYNPTSRTVAGASGTTADVFQAHGFAWTPNVVSIWRDATQLTNNSAIPSGPMIVGDQQNNIMIGNSFGGIADSRGTFPFACLINTTITNSIYSQIYNLYKNTLGKGLGLP